MSQQYVEKTTQRREDEQPQEMPTENEARQDITDALDSLDEMIENELSANEKAMNDLERYGRWEAEKERLRNSCICG